MKRSLTLLLTLTAVSLLFFTACNKGGGGSGEKVQLAMNVEPGHVQKLHYTSDQVITQKIMGMSQKVAQVTEIFILQEVESVDEKGNAKIKVTYERVKSSVENAITGKQTYDSDRDKNAEDSPLAAGYGMLVGKTFYMTMDKASRIVEVTGIEELMSGMFGDEDDEVSQALSKSFGPEAMKQNLQQMALVFPDVLVGEGDTWGENYELAGEFGLSVETTYEVENIDAENVVLALKGKVQTAENSSIDMGMMSMEYDISGEQNGTMEISRKTGMVSKSEINQEMDGKVKASGMTIPMSIRSTTTIEPY